ncbi:MAG: hypothetical protein Q8K30_02970 [Candidatus Gracilibacteria bacterium]|nr:hypothetical protein [Candidatus Gracilibacteria bacterium]MDP2396496.1 hypothetical protein [bacterium]MDP3381233.1 hypothetical protein [bacterium]
MTKIEEKRNLLKEVDIINDREYILSELKKSESEKSYSFEESYEYNLARLNKMFEKYENI